MMRSSSAGLARPVRTVPNLCRIDSTDLPMRSRASASSTSISSDISAAAHQSPDSLAGHYPVDVLLVVHVEDVEREVILHAQGQRGGVHDAQLALERVHVGDLLEELGVRVGGGVGGVD